MQTPLEHFFAGMPRHALQPLPNLPQARLLVPGSHLVPVQQPLQQTPLKHLPPLNFTTQELPSGHHSSSQLLTPSQAESLPQIKRQLACPPWIGLQTVSGGHSEVSPSSVQGEVQ